MKMQSFIEFHLGKSWRSARNVLKELSNRFYWRGLPDLQLGDDQTVAKTKNRKSPASKSRFIGKPKGLFPDRAKGVGPEHFGGVAVDCAKRRSKWMLCDSYGKNFQDAVRSRPQLCCKLGDSIHRSHPPREVVRRKSVRGRPGCVVSRERQGRWRVN